MRQAWEATLKGIPLEEHVEEHPEPKRAIEHFGERCLVYAQVPIGRRTVMSLHVVCEYWNPEEIHFEVSDIPAMVCPNCREKAFAPGISEQIIAAANEMFAAAARVKKEAPQLHQYVVEVA